MSDYIKRDDIIKWIDDSIAQCGNRYSADMLNMMEMFRTVVDNCLPFVNVVPAELYQRALNDVVTLSVERKHGKWNYYRTITGTDGWNHRWYKCSLCGRLVELRDNFCPNCGADMRGDSDV